MNTLLSKQILALADSRGTALDRLILADSKDMRQITKGPGQDILILDDPTGALTLESLALVLARGGRVLSRQRSYDLALELFHTAHTLGEEASARLLIAGLDNKGEIDPGTFGLTNFLVAHSFQGNLALGHLPKSHSALADTSYDFSTYQQAKGAGATLLVGGNTKHMVHTFNETLGQSFASVRGLRGKGKHRCLLATEPKPQGSPPKLAGALAAFGGVFSGGKPDAGGQLLARAFLSDLASSDNELVNKRPLTLLDLGCGNGSVSLDILGSLPVGCRVSALYATDLDLDAIRSATVNLTKNPAVQVSWDDAASRLPDASVDAVLLNPPFHLGTAVDLTLIGPLLRAAYRVLAPGGRLYLVHNSHARYRQQVEELFINTRQLERTPTFTVLSASKK
ncbi:class I SAM-dependent methyltransferase [Rothia sp. P4278]|uniref:class I SAM-dependent methyltransferase n=1 Tax=Rothia sp. P4278 TaxID=3402658 RepID=UPI003AE7195C